MLATTSKLVVGKEGTMTNVGACIAHMLSTQAAKLIGGSGGSKRRSGHGDKAATRQGFTEADMRDLVTVGAAAGISACFRAPVRMPGSSVYVNSTLFVGRFWRFGMVQDARRGFSDA